MNKLKETEQKRIDNAIKPVLPSTLTPGLDPNEVGATPADALNMKNPATTPTPPAPPTVETPEKEPTPQRSIEEFKDFLDE